MAYQPNPDLKYGPLELYDFGYGDGRVEYYRNGYSPDGFVRAILPLAYLTPIDGDRNRMNVFDPQTSTLIGRLRHEMDLTADPPHVMRWFAIQDLPGYRFIPRDDFATIEDALLAVLN